MPILQALQALIAALLLLGGIALTLALGITGLIVLLAAGLFAATAAAASTQSRAGVAFALAVDAAFAACAAFKLMTLRGGPLVDLAVPAVTLVLVAGAFAAVWRDWRNVRASPWF